MVLLSIFFFLCNENVNLYQVTWFLLSSEFEGWCSADGSAGSGVCAVRVGACVCVFQEKAALQAVSYQASGLHFLKISICHRDSVCQIKLSVTLC